MKLKLLALLALTTALSAFAADPQPASQPANQSSAGPGLSDEQVVQQFRNDMMAKRADIMAKGLTLTAEQASKFWPQFEQYPEGAGPRRQRADPGHQGIRRPLPGVERRRRARLRKSVADARPEDAGPAHQVAGEVPEGGAGQDRGARHPARSPPEQRGADPAVLADTAGAMRARRDTGSVPPRSFSGPCAIRIELVSRATALVALPARGQSTLPF